MPVLEELQALGAPITDAIRTAAFIASLPSGPFPREEKVRLLREYLRLRRLSLTPDIFDAGSSYLGPSV